MKKTQVYDSSVIAYPPIVHQHGLVTTVLGLHMQLDSSHFEDGLMRVKCLTSISPLIPIHSISMEGNAAEARESAYSGNGGSINGNSNRKASHAQRKPPLTDSREVFLLGKCTSLTASSSFLCCSFHTTPQATHFCYFCSLVFLDKQHYECTFPFQFTETELFHCSLLCHLLEFTVAWIQFTTSHFLRHFYVYVFTFLELCFFIIFFLFLLLFAFLVCYFLRDSNNVFIFMNCCTWIVGASRIKEEKKNKQQTYFLCCNFTIREYENLHKIRRRKIIIKTEKNTAEKNKLLPLEWKEQMAI